MVRKICESCFRLLRIDSPLRGRLHNIVPEPALKVIQFFRWELYLFIESIRIKKSVTKFLGPEFPPPHKKIEIDITYRCNMRCLYCNRFLDFAPSEEQMSIGQIKKFVRESIELDRKWEAIMLSGGEPTMHPQILNIANLVIDYKNNFSPSTKLYLLTNGVNRGGRLVFPPDICIYDSQKDIFGSKHIPTAVAPSDLNNYRDADFSNGCWVPSISCGMGLNLYGYYQCTVAANIDRIFGFDIGRKRLPSKQDSMIDLYRMFCRYCGFFIRTTNCGFFIRTTNPRKNKAITPTWEEAIEKYMKSRPSLTLY